MTKSGKIKVAVIGNGKRGRYVVGNLLRDSGRQVEIAAVYDPDVEQCRDVIGHWATPDAKICGSYAEAIAAPGVEWVMIFSPNAFHKEQILAAFAAGKHVFSEKPLATSIADCEEIYAAHRKSKLRFMTGFVLRYAPIYRKAKELLSSGAFGKILSIDANENITYAHGGYIMMNWRRKTELAGPHMLEKCCHDLDILNWLIDSLPSKIAAFGSRDYYVPENQHYFDQYGDAVFGTWDNKHRTPSPFTSDTDLKDTQVAILRYRNGVKVQFQATMGNALPERRMRFVCEAGNLSIELYKSILTYRRIGETEIKTIDFGADGHGGGDECIMKELFGCMTGGGEPKSSGSEGLESAVTALAIDRAMTEERVIDLEPVWQQLER